MSGQTEIYIKYWLLFLTVHKYQNNEGVFLKFVALSLQNKRKRNLYPKEIII